MSRNNQSFVESDEIGEAPVIETKQESSLDHSSPDTNGDPQGSE